MSAVKEILEIAENYHITSGQLYLDAKSVASCGENLFPPLMGYSAQDIGEAAQVFDL